MMTINLEDYLNKIVEVELIGGAALVGKVIKFNTVFHIKFPTYNQDGYSSIPVSPANIIKIKEIKETPTEPETMSNVIRSKIDIFTTEDERVEVTLDDDGLFLTACGKGAREDLSIGSKDLVICVARAILEHYQETLK